MADQPSQGQGTAGVTDAVTQLNLIARQLGLWVLAFKGRNTYGKFAFTSAVSSLVVPQPAVQANSFISWSPTNAAAGTLEGSSKKLYYTVSPGVSFTVFTSSGGNAAGSEQFSYFVSTPS